MCVLLKETVNQLDKVQGIHLPILGVKIANLLQHLIEVKSIHPHQLVLEYIQIIKV